MPQLLNLNGDASPGRTRSINIKVNSVREHVMNKEVDVRWIPSEDNPADIFTKPLTQKLFMRHRDKMVTPVQ